MLVSAGYDDLGGWSGGGALVTTSNGSGVGILRASGHIGYARSVARNMAVDGGLVVHSYTQRYSSGNAQTFAEVFAGVTWKQLALHASYTPSYLDQGLQSLYIEANAVQELGSGFRANARGGLLTRLGGEGSFNGSNNRYDAQLGFTKDFDRLSLYVQASTAGPGRGRYYDGPWRGRNALLLGLSRSF